MFMKKRTVIILGAIGMALWLLVFGLGILVTSQPYRDQVARAFDWASLLKAIVTFTPTNVAILSVLAGFLGGCASLLLYSDSAESTGGGEPGKPAVDAERLTFLTENPVNSALRGF